MADDDSMTTFDPAEDGAAGAAPAPESLAPDPDLADATETLAGQMEKPGSTPSPKPAAPPPVETKPTTSPRSEGYRRLQEGAKGRFQREKRELQERRTRQAQMEEQVRQSNALLEKQLEVMKGLRPPEQEEKAPDFMLDPDGFAAWTVGKTEAAIQAALKPVLEAEERRQAQVDQIIQEREQAAHVEAATNQLIDQYQTWEQEYIRDAPELAVGFQERFHTMRDMILAPAFEDAGYSPQEAQDRVNLWFHAISQGAAQEGRQPAAVLDAFFAGIARQFGHEPIGLDDVGDNGNGHQPAPRRPSETERQVNVQRRAAGAASAAPRVAARTPQTSSMLDDLYRGGERDRNALLSAAMKDAHGDPRIAAVALQRLAAQV